MSKLEMSSRILILGGGIHGASVAYHLAKRGVISTLVEENFIGSAASGKAGGFLARDWGSGPTSALHVISYAMHESLAKELQLKSYRKVPILSVNPNKSGANIPSWLDRTCSSTSMGDGTAQVTPLELTEKFMEEACKLGCTVLRGRANKVELNGNQIIGVHVSGHGFIKSEKLVVCLGPWSGVFCEDNFGVTMPMDGIKSTSILYENVEVITKEPYALFCDEDVNGCHLELYPRPNGDLYVCGCGGSDYVRGDRLREGGDCANSNLIKEDITRIEAAKASIKAMSSLGDADISKAQACMRPCPPDGLPIMGALEHISGAYVSAGHNCWGILWAPVSGLTMAELITDGHCKTIDLRPFSPLRFQKKNQNRGKKVGTVNIGEQW